MYTHQQDQWDREAAEQAEAFVVNVTDEVARFEIAGHPGTRPRKYALAPFGKRLENGSGDRVSLQFGYALPYKGAGPNLIRATIETLTEREVYPGIPGPIDEHGKRTWRLQPGPRLPMVVHVDKAEQARAAWLSALAMRSEIMTAAPKILLHTADGSVLEAEAVRTPAPVPESGSAPRAQARTVEPVEDVEDQSGGMMEPDPDLEAVTVPAADPAPIVEPEVIPRRGGGKGRG